MWGAPSMGQRLLQPPVVECGSGRWPWRPSSAHGPLPWVALLQGGAHECDHSRGPSRVLVAPAFRPGAITVRTYVPSGVKEPTVCVGPERGPLTLLRLGGDGAHSKQRPGYPGTYLCSVLRHTVGTLSLWSQAHFSWALLRAVAVQPLTHRTEGAPVPRLPVAGRVCYRKL